MKKADMIYRLQKRERIAWAMLLSAEDAFGVNDIISNDLRTVWFNILAILDDLGIEKNHYATEKQDGVEWYGDLDRYMKELIN